MSFIRELIGEQSEGLRIIGVEFSLARLNASSS